MGTVKVHTAVSLTAMLHCLLAEWLIGGLQPGDAAIGGLQPVGRRADLHQCTWCGLAATTHLHALHTTMPSKCALYTMLLVQPCIWRAAVTFCTHMEASGHVMTMRAYASSHVVQHC